MDWTFEGIQAVKKGNLHVSLGGHFMEGGWSLILINDYHHGIDFMEELGTTINLPLMAITQKNASKYLEAFTKDNWKNIDFKSYSKHYNPSLKKYNFTIERIFRELSL